LRQTLVRYNAAAAAAAARKSKADESAERGTAGSGSPGVHSKSRDDDADANADAFGRTVFRHAPVLPSDTFVVGWVTPVLHYTMGGLAVDASGAVLGTGAVLGAALNDGGRICGLHAVGEVTGGLHGHNRLGGNSLLECAVFGSIVGTRLADAMTGAGGGAAAVAPSAVKMERRGESEREEEGRKGTREGAREEERISGADAGFETSAERKGPEGSVTVSERIGQVRSARSRRGKCSRLNALDQPETKRATRERAELRE